MRFREEVWTGASFAACDAHAEQESQCLAHGSFECCLQGRSRCMPCSERSAVADAVLVVENTDAAAIMKRSAQNESTE